MQSLRLAIACVAIACAAVMARAATALHPGNAAIALAKIDASGRVDMTLRFDILAYALDEDPGPLPQQDRLDLLAGTDENLGKLLTEAREHFESGFELAVEGGKVATELVAFPALADVRAWQHEHLRHPLPMKLDAVVRAQLPTGTRAVTFRFPRVVSDVILTADCPGREPFAMPLKPGETSPPIAVDPAGTERTTEERAGAPGAAPPMSTLEALRRFIALGFTHIVPDGLDHVLFVLGLFLLSTSARALLLQVTAFTVAHSITLALTMLGVVDLSPSIVEPLIAASIAFVAIENVVTSRLHAWRPIVVFAFGLIHGMGFAGVLRELGLPRGQMVTALVGFNVGVELGQLAVIVVAFAVLGWWRKRAWYRRRVVIPLSAAIAAVGLIWTVQRIL